jgi:hypothetical protein
MVEIANPRPSVEPQIPEGTRISSHTFLEMVFLWLPNERAPGFPAVCVALLRQVILPFVLLAAPFLVIGLLLGFAGLRNFNPMAEGYGASHWWMLVTPLLVFGGFALVQELARYSFVRHADEPVRAVAIFTIVAIAMTVLRHYHQILPCLALVASQLIASAVILGALNYRPCIAAVIAALVVGQTAVSIEVPRILPSAHRAAAMAPVSQRVPTAGNMQKWAKLYPGAVLSRNQTRSILGVTTWNVGYTVKASPDEIGAFYAAVAKSEGFTNEQVMMGGHIFTRPNSNERFTYFILPIPSGSVVAFTATTTSSPSR